ncbi:MAG: serine/threonine protein kinase [Myxococcales bacterium FL481]|nr:MAG: serine/threonine protein kinase [Myxococcales bacterium FL481]
MTDARKDSSPRGTMIAHAHAQKGSVAVEPPTTDGAGPAAEAVAGKGVARSRLEAPSAGGTGSADLVGHTLLDRYFVLSRLGEGGMGTVYLAEHTTIQKKFAIKVLSQEYAHKPDLVERFLQEARAASMISQENVVEISDFGDTPDGSVFFVMEYLDGEDLSATLRREQHLPWPRVRNIMLQVCRALQSAHDAGIIHRDMKPENCFRIKRGRNDDFVKVLDFGIAKLSGQDETSSKGLTRTGMIFGTPEYMSPEQAQGIRPDTRVDIYALGIIMYELLTGRVPFTADTFMGILTKHMFEVPERPSSVAPEADIPADVEAIVLKAMQKDREYRFQTMLEMAEAIERAGDGHAPVAVVPEDPRASLVADEEEDAQAIKGRGRGVLAVAVAVVLGGAGWAGFRYWPRTDGSWATAANLPAAVPAATERVALTPTPERVEPEPADPATEPVAADPIVVPADPPMVTFWIETDVDAKIIDARDGGMYGMTNSEAGVQMGKSEDPLALILRAPGREDLSLSIVPNSDKRFEHTLTKSTKSSKRRSWSKRKAKPPAPPVDEEASTTLADGPNEEASPADAAADSVSPGESDDSSAEAKPPGSLHAPDLKDPFKR